MSGQWEVVGKKKDKNVKLNKQAAIKEQQQQKLLNGVTVEEVLPMSQLKNLYATKGNKENRKPASEKVVKKETTAKEKQQQKQAKKPQPDNKPKLFKSIEIAYHAIKAEELNNVYDKNKVVYPTTPIVWLREVAQFLNTRINVETPDVVFSNKPDNYPLCTMPVALRTVMEKGLKQAGIENTALFYDICLTSMANDMNKNLPALGHKLFIQLISQQYPHLSAGNVDKYTSLRNSYQNRPNIGLSILWALGQGGLIDLNVGLKVFQDLMYPIIEMKNYTRFVLKYLIAIVKKSVTSSKSLDIDQYFYILDLVYANKKNMTSDLTKELNEIMPICNDLILNNVELVSFIEPLMEKQGNISNKTCKSHLNCVLMKSMVKDTMSLNAWRKLYKNNMAASASLLSYFEQHWRSVSGSIDSKTFKLLLTEFVNINEEFDKLPPKQKRPEALEDCIKAIRRLNNKMAGTKKKGGSSCRFLFYSICFLIGSLVFIDVKQNGGWSNSTTSKALNKTGVYDYTYKAYDCASECTYWVHNHIEDAFPGITETTIKHTTPYIELGRDLGIIMGVVAKNTKEGIEAKMPYVIATIEEYAPGLIEKTKEISNKTLTTTIVYYEDGKEYLMTKVFVGKLAPEEIQKTILTYVDLSVEKVQEGYSWLYNTVLKVIK